MPLLFKDLTPTDLLDKIQALSAQMVCSQLNKSFFLIRPARDKTLNLTTNYKSQNEDTGIYTQASSTLMKQTDLLALAQEKLQINHFSGTHYVNNDASLKFHISLNQVGEIDEAIILGLIKFLINEAVATNSMHFNFKIIQPALYTNSRFKNNDQITIYFDKYTSTAQVIQLAGKVDLYLKNNHIPENNLKLGPKDKFGFNAFVSARFDNNKLLQKYDEYPFFDLELKQFFSLYKNVDLRHVPLCAFEAIFTRILISRNIHHLNNPEQNLQAADRAKVQQQFKIMVCDPKTYIGKMGVRESLPEKAASAGQNKKRKLELPTNAHISKFNTILSTIKKQLKNHPSPCGHKLYSQLIQAFSRYCTKETNYATFIEFKTACQESMNAVKPQLGNSPVWKQIYRSLFAIITFIGGPATYSYKKAKADVLFFKRTKEPVELLLKKVEEINPSKFIISV